MPEGNRTIVGRIGGLQSWANTPDRTARTSNARKAGPGAIDYHLARLDPERFANATDRQRLDAAEAMRKAYFARLALASVKARSRGGDAA
jgi:hypothetical protein